MNPALINYPVLENNNDFSFKYNVLREAGNKKISKKETRRKIHIVAIKLVNTTGRTIKYGKDFRFYSGSQEASVLYTSEAFSSIKQIAPLHFLYLLLSPLRFTVNDGTRSSSTPIGFVIGPALAVGNFAVAANANKKLKQELNNYSVIDKEIKNGEVFYGLIAIEENGFIPLTVKMSNQP